MSDEISRYEAVQAEEKKQAQEQAAKDAEAKRAQEEKAVKKQTFMQALGGSKIWNTRKQMPKIWYLML